MECADCDLIRYCSVKCQKEHRPQHEEGCNKRAAELRDELLFKQPDSSHLGDCPICCLPLPLDLPKSTVYHCCSKIICSGCCHADILRDIHIDRNASLNFSCPFCRQPPDLTSTDEECDKQRMKRLEANDPVAMCAEASVHVKNGDYSSAFEWHTKAAELGHTESHYRLAGMYEHGEGVEKDSGKKLYHLEEAAIGGHPNARYFLGCDEEESDNMERAVKHWIIAATQGEDYSIQLLLEKFRSGFVSKEDLAAALRAHQAAVDATKSHQRKLAEIATYEMSQQKFV